MWWYYHKQTVNSLTAPFPQPSQLKCLVISSPPPVSPHSCFIGVVTPPSPSHHSCTPPSTGSTAHLADIWTRSDNLHVSTGDYFAQITLHIFFFQMTRYPIVCHASALARPIGKQSTPPRPYSSQLLIFVCVWFQSAIPALLSFTD